jgi:alcohol dehydrogenase class IV
MTGYQRFRFRETTEIIFGVDTIAELPHELTKLRIKKLMIVCDLGVEAAGIIKKATDLLDKATIEYHIFNDIESNPKDSTIKACSELCKSENCDGVLGIGGGSPIDAAKAIAMLATNEGSLNDYCSNKTTSSPTY